MSNVGNQIGQHIVAIISLIIAIVALTYTTWREEESEQNRNFRLAAFEVLKNLGNLQVIVNYGHYEPDNSMGNPILGWGYVALAGDLSKLLPSPVPEQVDKLIQVWTDEWKKIKTDQASVDRISQQIDQARTAVTDQLYHLK